MANGTKHLEIAQADRIREKSAQGQKATRNGFNKIRETLQERKLQPYRESDDSNSEITVGIGERVKVGAKGIPPKALGAALVVLALAAAVVAILRALG